jgi:glycine betaine transporter
VLVGGLTGLQQGAVLASVPFTFVIVLVAWCLFKALRADPAVAEEPPRVAPRTIAVGPGTFELGPDDGERRP